MKTIKCISLIIIALNIMSCESRKINMLTVINPDGSCYKEFTNHADSQFMSGDTTGVQKIFPVNLDNTWQIKWQYNNGKIRFDFPLKKSDIHEFEEDNKSEFIVTIHKSFKSVEEMSRLKPVNQWNNQKIEYQLHKKFRWFYTYYEYTETYPKLKLTDDLVPLSKYMTSEEANYWFNDQNVLTNGMNGIEANELNQEIERKYEKWITHNIWHEYYRIFIENYDKISKPPVSVNKFVMLEDTIFNNETMEKLLNDTDPNPNNDPSLFIDSYFKTKSYSEFSNNNDSIFKQAGNKIIENIYGHNIVNYSLRLPGQVIRGNFISQKNGILFWKITSSRMVTHEFIIHAESRKINIWTFIITGVIILLAAGSWIYKGKKS